MIGIFQELAKCSWHNSHGMCRDCAGRAKQQRQDLRAQQEVSESRLKDLQACQAQVSCLVKTELDLKAQVSALTSQLSASRAASEEASRGYRKAADEARRAAAQVADWRLQLDAARLVRTYS